MKLAIALGLAVLLNGCSVLVPLAEFPALAVDANRKQTKWEWQAKETR